MSEQPEREWKKYLLSKGVFGNALRFVHLEKPEEVDRTPSRRSAGREKQVVGKVFGLDATGKFEYMLQPTALCPLCVHLISFTEMRRANIVGKKNSCAGEEHLPPAPALFVLRHPI